MAATTDRAYTAHAACMAYPTYTAYTASSVYRHIPFKCVPYVTRYTLHATCYKLYTMCYMPHNTLRHILYARLFAVYLMCSTSDYNRMCAYLCISYTSIIHVYTYIYIYIYIERERERQRETKCEREMYTCDTCYITRLIRYQPGGTGLAHGAHGPGGLRAGAADLVSDLAADHLPGAARAGRSFVPRSSRACGFDSHREGWSPWGISRARILTFL